MTSDIATTPTIASYPHIDQLRRVLLSKFPYFAKIVEKRVTDFGISWLACFEEELGRFFGDDQERLSEAVKGYGQFSLDAMKMQKQFDKARAYKYRSYDDVAKDVYLNRDYMFNLYLPGILLSHYLWPHHYQQVLLFRGSFLPLAEGRRARLFFDVGIGTGFYSKELLRGMPAVHGRGFDISPFSLEHGSMMVRAWGGSDRYDAVRADILAYEGVEKADCVVCVEVLEHLEDPRTFLKGVRKMMRAGAIGFITAAVNAPNADHIYLYRSVEEVADDVRAAGFWVQQTVETFAYQPKSGESVPSNGICIVEA